MKNYIKHILWIVAILLIVGLFYYIINYFTFGFTALFCFLIIFLLLPLFLNDRLTQNVINRATGKKDKEYITHNGGYILNSLNRIKCAFAIFIFGLLALFSLENYINPSSQTVFSNYNHHAIKVEGVKLGNIDNFKPFPLAGDDPQYFFDAPYLKGKIDVQGFTADSVELKMKGFMNPIYLKRTTNDHKNINSTLISFKKGEVVELYGTEKDAQGNRFRCRFVMTEGHEDGYFRPKDSLNCVFYYENGDSLVSSYHRFLKSGYPLSSLAANYPTKMDLNGIKIVRDSINLKVERRHLYSTYSERGYLIELSPTAQIHSIVVNGGEPKIIDNLFAKTKYIKVPTKTALYLGNGNYSSNAFKFDVDDSGKILNLKYEMPHYRFLSANDDDQSTALMVTTSIISNPNPKDGESGLIDKLTDNVVLFDLFNNYDNKFHIDPFFISYKCGPTNEEMLFTVSSSDNKILKHDIKADSLFTSIKSKNNETEWIVSVENFKDSTNFNASLLAWVLVAIIVLSSLSMFFTVKLKTQHGFRQVTFLYTGLEYAFHIIIIAFLTIRFFMLWRATVFPPISSISLFEYEHFRNNNWLLTPIIMWGVFFVVINLTKIVLHRGISLLTCLKCLLHMSVVAVWGGFFLGYYDILISIIFSIIYTIICLIYKFHETKWISLILDGSQKKWGVCILMIIVDIIAFFVAKVSGSPVLSVFLPIAVYMFFEAYIYINFSNTYIQDIKHNRFNHSDSKRTHVLLLSLLNMILTSIVTLFVDGGFGIMFTLFAIFAFWVKIADLFQFTRYVDKKTHIFCAILFILLGIGLIFVVVYYKDILIGMFQRMQKGTSVWIFFAVAWVAISLLIYLTIGILRVKLNKWWHIGIQSFIIIGCVVAALLGPDAVSGTHMEYRTRVHMEPAGEILKTIDSQEAQDKFLQASLNDWIIYEYQQVGKDVSSLGEGGNGYFKLQPQSKLGAMWFAQTTDICLSRYIIAEHGTMLAVLFVIAFVVLLLISILTKSTNRWARIITIQVTLLFAVQALMIFLANTNAFIFFGQDFPIISLTSRLSSIYFFSLATLAVCMALISKRDYYTDLKKDINNPKEQLYLGGSRTKICFYTIVVFLVAMGLLSTVQNPNVNVKDNNKSYYREDMTYDVDEILTQSNNDLEKINVAFKQYQKDYLDRIPPLEKNMSHVVEDFFSKFDKDSLLRECQVHTKHSINQFASKWSKENSRNNLIYLKYNKTFDRKSRVSDTLEFAMRSEYYNYKLPGKIASEWKGSILGSSTEELPEESYKSSHSGYSYAYLPAKYSANGNPIQLLKSKNAQVISSDAILALNNDLDVVEVDALDHVIGKNSMAKNAPLATQTFIAKSILLNGNRQFIYPYGQKLFWAKEDAYYTKKRKNKEKDFSHKNVMYTVDNDLCSEIYDGMASYNSGDDMTVVVADGDGNIRALVDYRMNARYRLNPNDYKRIADISDSIEIYGERGRARETRYFGSFNRDYLRNGPGSSQKPLLWTAVTSMYNTGWWKKLQLGAIDNYIHDNYLVKISKSYKTAIVGNPDKYVFRNFAGHRIESNFRSIRGDEGFLGKENINVGIQYYMYQSSNFYNAIIAYLGAFPHSYFSNETYISGTPDQQIFRSYKLNQRLKVKNQEEEDRRFAMDYLNTFPTIYIDKGKKLVFNKFLEPDFALDQTGLAQMGLRENFGLDGKSESAYNPSRYNTILQKKSKTPREMNEYMVRAVAIGSNSVWQVSPRKMAEMYGRLISMNQNYSLTIEEQDVEYKFFDLDESWGNAPADYTKYKEYLEVRKELLQGMSQVHSIGTAKRLGLNGCEIDNTGYKLIVDDGEAPEEGKYLYIYGKTGTIDGKWGGKKTEDHLLATVITDKKMSQCSLEELKTMKFYVIYQADYGSAEWEKKDKQVIEKILQSDVFKNYMGINR